jgi:hypothetical protein
MTTGNKPGHSIYILLTICILLIPAHCKKKPTAPDMPISPQGSNAIFISCSPTSGGTGTIVDVDISINENNKNIDAFGMDMTFDSAIFQYQEMGKGSLTDSWAEVNGNVTTPGLLIIGGFKGAGTSIDTNSIGILATVRLKVIYSGADDNFTREISIKNYKDNIAGMLPDPASTSFTFIR